MQQPTSKPASKKISQKPMPPPYPPGLIATPSASSTGPWQPAGAPKPAPKKKPNPKWKSTHRGKRDLLRTVQHHRSLQNQKFWDIGKDPSPLALKMKDFPSDYFLWKAEPYLLARYASFLLQSLLILVRVFEIPSLLKNKFGEGLLTVPRYALFFCRTDTLTNPAALRILSLERHLYARMIETSEGVAEPMEDVLKNEWLQDRVNLVNDRIAAWIKEKIAPGIESGLYPKTNLDYDPERQWDDVWQAFNACLCLQLFTFPLSSHKGLRK